MTDAAEDDRPEGSGKGPDAFRTISEVAEDLGLPQHVLRFWETRFPQIKPIKRGGGRRYYRPNDVELLRGVKQLLYGEGYTIRGVQRILREQGGRKLAQAAGAGGGVAQEPQVSRETPGPELWAPQRRVSAPVNELLDDPALDPGAYPPDDEPEQAEPERTPPAGLEPAQTAKPGLSNDQTRRLGAALDELAACKRLLRERL